MQLSDYKLLHGEISACDTPEDFKIKFREIFKSDDAKKTSNVVYVWLCEKVIPRLQGRSNIIYIGKTSQSLYNRHARYASVEANEHNWSRYKYILNQFGPIRIQYKTYNNKELRTKEAELLNAYFNDHLEWPPLNRITR